MATIAAAGLFLGTGTANAAVLDVPHFRIAQFGFNQDWRVSENPRFVADVTGPDADGKKRADIVGFNDDGVYVSVASGDGFFAAPVQVIEDFGSVKGWNQNHERLVVDITGDGRADIVGRGNAGVFVSVAQGGGTFGPVRLAVPNFGGGRPGQLHVANVSGLAPVDLVEIPFEGFNDTDPIRVAPGRGDGSFGTPFLGSNAGNHGCAPSYHVVDITGDRRAEIMASHVGCVFVAPPGPADASNFIGVGVLRANTNGRFDDAWLPAGANVPSGAAPLSIHAVADMNGDQLPDLVEQSLFTAVRTALSQGDGTFANTTTSPVLRRSLGDVVLAGRVSGDNRADLVGFAADGAYVSISRADGSSQAEFKAVNDFGSNKGWRLDKHVRVLADINGDNLLDIVGFGDAGVFVALANLDGTYR